MNFEKFSNFIEELEIDFKVENSGMISNKLKQILIEFSKKEKI